MLFDVFCKLSGVSSWRSGFILHTLSLTKNSSVTTAVFPSAHFWAHFGAVHEKGWWKLHFWHFSNKFWSCENLTRRRRRRRRPRRPRLSAENYFLVDTEKFQSILPNWTKIAKTSLHFFLMAEATALISSSFPSLGLFIDLFFPQFPTFIQSPFTRTKLWQVTKLQTTDTLEFVCVISTKCVISRSHYVFVTWAPHKEVEELQAGQWPKLKTEFQHV